MAVAENDDNNIFALIGAARDQTFAGGFGVPGFHSVAVGQSLQQFVRVF